MTVGIRVVWLVEQIEYFLKCTWPVRVVVPHEKRSENLGEFVQQQILTQVRMQVALRRWAGFWVEPQQVNKGNLARSPPLVIDLHLLHVLVARYDFHYRS